MTANDSQRYSLALVWRIGHDPRLLPLWMSPMRLSPCAFALTLLVAGVLGAFWQPLAPVAGLAILGGLILALIALVLHLIDRFQRS